MAYEAIDEAMGVVQQEKLVIHCIVVLVQEK